MHCGNALPVVVYWKVCSWRAAGGASVHHWWNTPIFFCSMGFLPPVLASTVCNRGRVGSVAMFALKHSHREGVYGEAKKFPLVTLPRAAGHILLSAILYPGQRIAGPHPAWMTRETITDWYLGRSPCRVFCPRKRRRQGSNGEQSSYNTG